MSAERQYHSLGAIKGAVEVLIVGGTGGTGSCDIYNADTNSIHECPNLPAGQIALKHTVSQLSNGDLLHFGGVSDIFASLFQNSSKTWITVEPPPYSASDLQYGQVRPFHFNYNLR